MIRSVMHKNLALPYCAGVVLCLFWHVGICPGQNSETTVYKRCQLKSLLANKSHRVGVQCLKHNSSLNTFVTPLWYVSYLFFLSTMLLQQYKNYWLGTSQNIFMPKRVNDKLHFCVQNLLGELHPDRPALVSCRCLWLMFI